MVVGFIVISVFTVTSGGVALVFGGTLLGAPPWSWGFVSAVAAIGSIRFHQAAGDKSDLLLARQQLSSDIGEVKLAIGGLRSLLSDRVNLDIDLDPIVLRLDALLHASGSSMDEYDRHRLADFVSAARGHDDVINAVQSGQNIKEIIRLLISHEIGNGDPKDWFKVATLLLEGKRSEHARQDVGARSVP